jgi:hypothetical protein
MDIFVWLHFVCFHLSIFDIVWEEYSVLLEIAFIFVLKKDCSSVIPCQCQLNFFIHISILLFIQLSNVFNMIICLWVTQWRWSLVFSSCSCLFHSRRKKFLSRIIIWQFVLLKRIHFVQLGLIQLLWHFWGTIFYCHRMFQGTLSLCNVHPLCLSSWPEHIVT